MSDFKAIMHQIPFPLALPQTPSWNKGDRFAAGRETGRDGERGKRWGGREEDGRREGEKGKGWSRKWER